MGNLGGSAASLGLVQMGDILTITATSKAIGAAVGSYPFVIDDIAGIPAAPSPTWAPSSSRREPLRRVLTTADVGPMAP